MNGKAWRDRSAACLAAAVLAGIALACAPAVSARQTVGIPEISATALPPEAHATLINIGRGGPFPYERDGLVFGNYEKRLPEKERGYYREYTVVTPGLTHRGARRIVAGGCPGSPRGMREQTRRDAAGGRLLAPCSPEALYYTDDHYQSFRRIRR